MKNIIIYVLFVILISSCSLNIWDEWVKLDWWNWEKIEIWDKWLSLNDNNWNNLSIWDDWLNIDVSDELKEMVLNEIESIDEEGIKEAADFLWDVWESMEMNENIENFTNISESKQIEALNFIIDNEAFDQIPLNDQKFLINFRDALVALINNDSKGYIDNYIKANTFISLKLKRNIDWFIDNNSNWINNKESVIDNLNEYISLLKEQNNILRNDKINDNNIVLLHSFINSLTGASKLDDYLSEVETVDYQDTIDDYIDDFIKNEINDFRDDIEELKEFISNDL